MEIYQISSQQSDLGDSTDQACKNNKMFVSRAACPEEEALHHNGILQDKLDSDGETDLSRGLETLQVQTGKDSYTVLNGDLGQGLGKWANRLSEQGSVETPAFSKQPGTAFVLDQENNEVPESPPNCKEDQRSGAKSPGLKGNTGSKI
ncbi:long-chain-fatty-acid-CoA ligase ACSBG2-like [Arapaima gigas]